LLRNCSIVLREEVTDLNNFSRMMRLVFWKRKPSRTCISQEGKSASRFEAAKDKFTLLLDDNAERDYKLKPVLMYHSNIHVLKKAV
jgi:hypothetical protein